VYVRVCYGVQTLPLDHKTAARSHIFIYIDSMYIYIHICMYVCVYICMCTYVRMYIHMMYMYVCEYKCINQQRDLITSVSINGAGGALMCIYLFIHKYICIYGTALMYIYQ